MEIMKKVLLTALVVASFGVSANTPANDELTTEVMAMDSALFDKAFNQCNLTLYKKLVSPELEFYDDRTGLNTDFSKEIASFNDRCSKPHKVIRKLVDADVYVLGNYGAVEIGEHDFYVDDTKVENAKFIIIWERTADSWIMKRTVSFEHKAAGHAN